MLSLDNFILNVDFTGARTALAAAAGDRRGVKEPLGTTVLGSVVVAIFCSLLRPTEHSRRAMGANAIHWHYTLEHSRPISARTSGSRPDFSLGEPPSEASGNSRWPTAPRQPQVTKRAGQRVRRRRGAA